MGTTWVLRRSREAIERLGGARLVLPELVTEAWPQLRRAIGFDAGGLALNDPFSNLPAEVVTDSPVYKVIEPRLWQIEFRAADLNKFATLIQGPRRVRVLSATAGAHDLARSTRWTELLGPVGLGDELRAALVVDGLCWGMLCLHRDSAAGPFVVEDRRWATAVLASLGLAARAAWTTNPRLSPVDDGPGTLVVSDTAERLSWTPGAGRWLARLGASGVTAVHAMTARLGAPAARLPEAAPAADALVRARDGTWVELHGERLTGPKGDIAITLQAAHPGNVAPLLMAAHGLSAREQDVVRLVLDGLSTARIAQVLFISEYTVQDHLRAIFTKVGVRTRRQLVVRMAGGSATDADSRDGPAREGNDTKIAAHADLARAGRSPSPEAGPPAARLSPLVVPATGAPPVPRPRGRTQQGGRAGEVQPSR